MRVMGWEVHPLDWLLVFLPISFGLHLTHVSEVAVFVTSCLAVIPLAGLMGRATEHLAADVGDGLGGLLNATFGNAAELIIAIIALREGMIGVVKASLTGSIIGNSLLVGGLAILVGGLRHERQRFNATASSLGATLLALSAAGLLVPALYAWLPDTVHDRAHLGGLSLAIAVVLFVTYLLSLVFNLKTHSHLFAVDTEEETHSLEDPWSRRRAFGTLVAATLGVAAASELLVGSVEHTAERFGMSEVFVGVILVAVVGNAAEHSTAVLMAAKNKMDLAMNIAIGSSIQVALLIAPLMVFIGYFMGVPMDLIFTPLEVAAVALSVGVLALVANDGESHWMEGVLLVALYLILGITFWFVD